MTLSSDGNQIRPRPSRHRRKRRRPSPSSPAPLLLRPARALASAALLLLLVAASSPLLRHHRTSFLPSSSLRMPHLFQIYAAEAKEIVATREWQLLGENDTIPAGLHVRMDLTTGEKWVKIASDEDDDEGIKASVHDGSGGGGGRVEEVEMDAHGALSVVEASSDDATAGAAGDASGAGGGGNEIPIERDYEMMHRVISQLPAEELERIGGLPALPSAANDTDDLTPSGAPSLSKLTPEQREAFEARMEEIWKLRQEELARVQEENVADLPSMLKERVKAIREYLSDPAAGLTLLAERDANGGEGSSAEEDPDAPAIVTNVVEALRDLEYHLADVDMARDFHTLGGWPYLVALLDERMHGSDGSGGRHSASIDEVRALAAMCVGTAIGNLGEFRGRALEDAAPAMNEVLSARARNAPGGAAVEAVHGPASALSLLAKSFEDELSRRSERMAGGTVAVPDRSSGRAYRSRATYKLRATYALGAMLRGNPAAQRSFVAGRGAEVLARDALGTLSTVRGPLALRSGALAKLDYKFASKVLALGEDVVVGVVLHGEDYAVDDGGAAGGGGDLTANQIVGAFATERWCDLALRMLAPPSDVIGAGAGRGMQERALGAVRALAPVCRRDEPLWGSEEVKRVRSQWNREGSGDGMDPTYRRELLDLADGVLEDLADGVLEDLRSF